MFRQFLTLFLLFSSLLGCGEVKVGSTLCSLAAYSRVNTGDEIGIGFTDYGGSSLVQPFVVTADGTATSVVVQLSVVGSFTANVSTLTATIESNSAGKPDGVPLATARTIDPASLSTTSATAVFSFVTPPTLTSGTQYWLRIKASYPLSTTKYVKWSGFNGVSGRYSSGGVKLQAFYETGTPGVYNNSLIGDDQFFVFNIGC